MTITFREDQAAPLTWTQLDDNFRGVLDIQESISRQVVSVSESAESASNSKDEAMLSAELAKEMAEISVVRWCGNSTTPPTTRLDGSPLQISDEYGNLTDHLRYNWTGTAWVALNSSAQQLEVNLAKQTGGVYGSAQVGHLAPINGSVGMTLREAISNTSLFPEMFGAVGDGIADDSPAFYSMQVAKGHIRLKPDRVYRLTNEFQLSNRSMDMNGSTIKFDLALSTQRAMRVMDNACLYGGVIDLYPQQNLDTYGDAQIPIIVGEYYAGTGYKNCTIDRMTISNHRRGGMCIFVTGDSSNIVISNIHSPTTDMGAAVVYAEWGGTVGVKTYHPHNMRWSNITAGARSVVLGGPDGIILGTSGCYNVLIENFTVEAASTSNMCPIGVKIGGGAGFAFAANPEIRNMRSPNVVFRNGVILNDGARPGIWLLGRSSTGARTWAAGGIEFQNVYVRGTPANNGTLTEYTRGGKFINCAVTKSLHGHASGVDVQGTEYIGGSVYENWQHGVSIGNAGSPPKDIKVIGIEAFRNGQRSLTEMGTYYAGIYLNNSEGAEVSGCICGSVEGVETQYYSVHAGGASPGRVKNAKVYNNNTRALRNLRAQDTPSAYFYGSTPDDYTPALPNGRFQNNTCDESVTAQRYLGMRPLITHTEEAPIGSTTSVRVKRCIGPIIPTQGEWNKGDTLTYTPGGTTKSGGWVGAVCVVSGANGGTWENVGMIRVTPRFAFSGALSINQPVFGVAKSTESLTLGSISISATVRVAAATTVELYRHFGGVRTLIATTVIPTSGVNPVLVPGDFAAVTNLGSGTDVWEAVPTSGAAPAGCALVISLNAA